MARFDWVSFVSSTQIYVSVTPDSCQAALDLMFLLDASGSIEMPALGGAVGNFHDKVLGFVKELIPYFQIGHGNNETQVGVFTFSDIVNEAVLLNQYDTAAGLVARVDTIPYTQGGTYTSSGLSAIRTSMMSLANGMRPLSAGVSRVLIVMTDGASTSGYWPDVQAQLIRDENVNVYAMGVGTNLNLTQLEVMASAPDNVYVAVVVDAPPPPTPPPPPTH
jgi:hypothetical protein